MGIDPVRRTGNEGTTVPAGINREPGRVLRENRVDVQNHVGQRFIQRLDIEHVALFELIEVRKHSLPGKAGMPGDDGMRSLTADRERRTEKMTEAAIQRAFLGAVIDGQFQTQNRDFKIAHDPVAPDIQEMIVALGSFLQSILGVGLFGHAEKRSVVILSVSPCADLLGIIHLLHSFGVLGFDDAPVGFGNKITYEGIERYTHGDDGKCSTDHNFRSFSHFLSIRVAGRHLPPCICFSEITYWMSASCGIRDTSPGWPAPARTGRTLGTSSCHKNRSAAGQSREC